MPRQCPNCDSADVRSVTELHSWCGWCGTLDIGGVFQVPRCQAMPEDDGGDEPGIEGDDA